MARPDGSEGVERDLARRSRLVAVVLVGAMGLWLGLQWIGAAMGWPVGLVFAIDALALAGFAWAMASTWGIWRRRRQAGGQAAGRDRKG